MYSPPESVARNVARNSVDCLRVLARTCCCLESSRRFSTDDHLQTRSGLLAGHEASIEASTSSPPRLLTVQRTSPSKGSHPPEGGLDSRSRHRRPGSGSSASRSDDGSASPKKRSLQLPTSESKLSLLDDEDFCSTCLEGYTEDNPRVVAKCGHHYHLPCIFEWSERSRECPMCGKLMECDALLP